jgi:RNA polymerase sigma-70 factor (ECF subfamily)
MLPFDVQATVNVSPARPREIRALTDRELITQVLAGESAAYGILVERYQRKIYRVAYAILRDEAEADTVTQDTFVQAYTSLSRFEGRSELETWLTRIAINRSRDFLRRRKVVSIFSSRDDRKAPLLEPVDRQPGPERELLAHELRAAIERAVETLSSQQKVIFCMRHYEDYSLTEIAELLGLRDGTVRAHLFRAIHKVRRELSDWMPGSNAANEGP